MTVLQARDLLSDRVVEVSAEARPLNVLAEVEARQATHVAVFDTGRWCGLIRLQDVLSSSPQRIFADLLPDSPGPTVAENAPAETVDRVLRETGRDALGVLGGEGAFVGAVTRKSLVEALFVESEHLGKVVQAERDRIEGWAARLGTLNDAGRRLLSLISRRISDQGLLQEGIEILTELAEARYGAVGVFDDEGGLETFLHTGLTPEEVERIGPTPKGIGLLGVLTNSPRVLRLEDLTRDPRSVGLPPGHPEMRSFLGVPIRGRERVLGRVYLTEKKGGTPFTQADQELTQIFAASLAMAIEETETAQRLRRSEDQLRQAQKMEAVGQLAGGVAHDFNNLLTVISGYGEMLLAELEKDCELYDAAQEIQRAANRAGLLTRQLLTFSRRQILQPEILNLNDVVREMVRMLRRLIGEDLGLTLTLDPDLGAVKADPGQIEQIVANLVVNARDALLEGGALTIETCNTTLNEASAQRDTSIHPGAYVLLAVTDTGIGMDAEVQARIFDPFFTTKDPGKGTGLGLSTVYGIVTQSGGHIRVESRPGCGSRFDIYFPRLEATPEDEALKPRPFEHQAAAAVTETVLLVEDEDGVRRLARRVLEGAGYTVLEARHGREALAVAQAHAGPIHGLVTDVVMPEMGGVELARQIRTLRPGVRILFMSGYAGGMQHPEVPRDAFMIHKPFSPLELARKLREVLSA